MNQTKKPSEPLEPERWVWTKVDKTDNKKKSNRIPADLIIVLLGMLSSYLSGIAMGISIVLLVLKLKG